MKDNQQINPVVAADGMSIEFELRGLPSLKFDLRKVSEINRTVRRRLALPMCGL